MKRTIVLGALALAAALSVPAIGTAHDDKDNDKKPPMDAVVQFAHLVVSPAPPAGSLCRHADPLPRS